tara:strand:- start:977 stop:1261 length:285 start_codon:yes stop_codon:yes gene_type:complete
MRLCPIGLTTGARIVVTLLWTHDAAIAGSETPKAGKTVSLTEALIRLTVAFNTVNYAGKRQRKMAAYQRVEVNSVISNGKVILHVARELGDHFS